MEEVGSSFSLFLSRSLCPLLTQWERERERESVCEKEREESEGGERVCV